MDAASVEECVFRCTDCLSLPADAIDEALEDGGLDQVRESPGSLLRKSGLGVRRSLSDTRPSWRPAASPVWETLPSFWRRRSSMSCSPRWRKPGTMVELMAREKYPDLPPELFQTPRPPMLEEPMLEEGNATITDYGLLRREGWTAASKLHTGTSERGRFPALRWWGCRMWKWRNDHIERSNQLPE